jgi:hypothetical protein
VNTCGTSCNICSEFIPASAVEYPVRTGPYTRTSQPAGTTKRSMCRNNDRRREHMAHTESSSPEAGSKHWSSHVNIPRPVTQAPSICKSANGHVNTVHTYVRHVQVLPGRRQQQDSGTHHSRTQCWRTKSANIRNEQRLRQDQEVQLFCLHLSHENGSTNMTCTAASMG